MTNKPLLICFIGTLRGNDLTYQNLMEKLIKPLNADLIFCVSRISKEDENFIHQFNDCNIIDIYIYEEGKDQYQEFLDNVYNKFTLEQQQKWSKYFEIEGNWLGGIKGRKGSGFHLTFNYWKLLKRLEFLQTKGFNYQQFILTRTDFYWLVEHPPLHLLNPNSIWIPTGENYNGYNDRHAVCSKNNVSTYLNMFEYMTNFTALDYIYNNLDGNNLNHERYLKSHLDYCKIQIKIFKNVAYLTGSKQTLTNWSLVKSKFIEGKEYIYKYEEELLSSLEHFKEFESHQDWNKLIPI